MIKHSFYLSLLIFSLNAGAVTDETNCDTALTVAADFRQAADKLLPLYKENLAIIRHYINPNYDLSVLHQLVILSLKLHERPDVVGKAFRQAKNYVYVFGMPKVEVGFFASFGLWLGVESGASIDQMLARNTLLLTEMKLRKNVNFDQLKQDYQEFLGIVNHRILGPRLDYIQAQQLFLAATRFSLSTATIKEALNREMRWYHVSSVNRRQTCVWALIHGMDCEQVAKNIEALTYRVLGRLSPNRHEGLTYELALNLKDFSTSSEDLTDAATLDRMVEAYNQAYNKTQLPFSKGSQTLAIKLLRLSLLKPDMDKVLDDIDRLKNLGSFHRVNVHHNSDYLDILEIIYKGLI